MMNLYQVAMESSRRLTGMFVRDGNGRRPVYGGLDTFQNDPHWRDNILFYEFFHGDNGAGMGANHRTGRTGLVAKFLQVNGLLDEKEFLENGVRPMLLAAEAGK